MQKPAIICYQCSKWLLEDRIYGRWQYILPEIKRQTWTWYFYHDLKEASCQGCQLILKFYSLFLDDAPTPESVKEEDSPPASKALSKSESTNDPESESDDSSDDPESESDDSSDDAHYDDEDDVPDPVISPANRFNIGVFGTTSSGGALRATDIRSVLKSIVAVDGRKVWYSSISVYIARSKLNSMRSGRTIMYFQATYSDEPEPRILSVKPWVQQFFDPQLINSWLTTCDCIKKDKVVACKETLPSSFRIIDVDKKCLVPVDFSKPVHFASLSYMWGKSNENLAALTSESIKRMFTEGELAQKDIPSLLIDCMDLAKELGFKYLWIDRFCIIQGRDAKAKSDQAAQIPFMETIYRYATVVITLALNNPDLANIPGYKKAREWGEPATLSEGGTKTSFQKDSKVSGYSFSDDQISKSLWNTRGWTFQERILANRRLYITEGHTFYDCRCGYAIENITWGLDQFSVAEVSHETFGREGKSAGTFMRIPEDLNTGKNMNPKHLDAIKAYILDFDMADRELRVFNSCLMKWVPFLSAARNLRIRLSYWVSHGHLHKSETLEDTLAVARVTLTDLKSSRTVFDPRDNTGRFLAAFEKLVVGKEDSCSVGDLSEMLQQTVHFLETIQKANDAIEALICHFKDAYDLYLMQYLDSPHVQGRITLQSSRVSKIVESLETIKPLIKSMSFPQRIFSFLSEAKTLQYVPPPQDLQPLGPEFFSGLTCALDLIRELIVWESTLSGQDGPRTSLLTMERVRPAFSRLRATVEMIGAKELTSNDLDDFYHFEKTYSLDLPVTSTTDRLTRLNVFDIFDSLDLLSYPELNVPGSAIRQIINRHIAAVKARSSLFSEEILAKLDVLAVKYAQYWPVASLEHTLLKISVSNKDGNEIPGTLKDFEDHLNQMELIVANCRVCISDDALVAAERMARGINRAIKGEINLADNYNVRFVPHTMTYMDYFKLITEYSMRTFTFYGDRVNAMSGVVSHAARDQNWEFICGALVNDFPASMLWSTTTPPREFVEDFPSWSWANVKCKIKFSFRYFQNNAVEDVWISKAYFVKQALLDGQARDPVIEQVKFPPRPTASWVERLSKGFPDVGDPKNALAKKIADVAIKHPNALILTLPVCSIRFHKQYRGYLVKGARLAEQKSMLRLFPNITAPEAEFLVTSQINHDFLEEKDYYHDDSNSESDINKIRTRVSRRGNQLQGLIVERLPESTDEVTVYRRISCGFKHGTIVKRNKELKPWCSYRTVILI